MFADRKKRVVCGCGVETTKRNLSHHRKTKRHTKWLEQQNMKYKLVQAAPLEDDE